MWILSKLVIVTRFSYLKLTVPEPSSIQRCMQVESRLLCGASWGSCHAAHRITRWPKVSKGQHCLAWLESNKLSQWKSMDLADKPVLVNWPAFTVVATDQSVPAYWQSRHLRWRTRANTSEYKTNWPPRDSLHFHSIFISHSNKSLVNKFYNTNPPTYISLNELELSSLFDPHLHPSLLNHHQKPLKWSTPTPPAARPTPALAVSVLPRPSAPAARRTLSTAPATSLPLRTPPLVLAAPAVCSTIRISTTDWC